MLTIQVSSIVFLASNEFEYVSTISFLKSIFADQSDMAVEGRDATG